MTQRKTGLARDRHFALGLELAKLQDQLNGYIEMIGMAYPSNGPETRAVQNIGKAIEKARAVLDGAICRETPPTDQDVLRAYYPDNHGFSGYTRWTA